MLRVEGLSASVTYVQVNSGVGNVSAGLILTYFGSHGILNGGVCMGDHG